VICDLCADDRLFSHECAGASFPAAEVVKRFYRSWNRGDIEGVVSCFAEEAVYHDAIYLEPFIGKAALGAYFRKFSGIDGLDALKFKVTEMVADEHGCSVAWCVATWTSTRFPLTSARASETCLSTRS
jgi:hypothetical protein